MSTFNYSKWDNIELSDDESDLHPNIDKESWFRMKHRARIEREEKEDHEIKELERKNDENNNRLKIINARLNGLSNNKDDNDEEYEDVDALKAEAKELDGLVNTRNKRISDIKKKRAWNIDNICKVSEEKTIVNKSEAQSLKASEFAPTGITESNFAEAELSKTNKKEPVKSDTNSKSDDTTVKKASDNTATTTTTKTTTTATTSSNSTVTKSKSTTKAANKERLQVLSYNDYVLTYESILENYSEINDIEATKEFLFKNCDILLHEHAQSYMLLSCLEDEMNGKRDRMKLVCRQSQILSHITELGVSMKRDPRDVVLPFFMRIQEKEYFTAFVGAINDFVTKIIERAIVKRKEMDKERDDENEEMQRNVPLGPGGLNPFEVLKQLPDTLRNAFESQDLQQLQDVLASMEAVEAKKWMKLCVDSGLWVPKDEQVFEEDDEEGVLQSSDDIE